MYENFTHPPQRNGVAPHVDIVKFTIIWTLHSLVPPLDGTAERAYYLVRGRHGGACLLPCKRTARRSVPTTGLPPDKRTGGLIFLELSTYFHILLYMVSYLLRC